MANADEIRQKLDEGVDLFMKLYGEGDYEVLAKTCYSHDYVIMPPEGPMVHQSGLKDFFSKSDVTRYVSANDENVIEGNMAVSRGHYTGYRKDGDVAGSGRYIIMWVPREGTWLMKFVMWSKGQ